MAGSGPGCSKAGAGAGLPAHPDCGPGAPHPAAGQGGRAAARVPLAGDSIKRAWQAGDRPGGG